MLPLQRTHLHLQGQFHSLLVLRLVLAVHLQEEVQASTSGPSGPPSTAPAPGSKRAILIDDQDVPHPPLSKEVKRRLKGLQPTIWVGQDVLPQLPLTLPWAGPVLVISAFDGISALVIALLALGMHVFVVCLELLCVLFSCTPRVFYIDRLVFPGPPAHIAARCARLFGLLSQRANPAVRAGYLRAIFNGWPTSARMRTCHGARGV